MNRFVVALLLGCCWLHLSHGTAFAEDTLPSGLLESSGFATLRKDDPAIDEVGRLPSVRNRDAVPIGGWVQLTREIEFPDDRRVLNLIVEVKVDAEGCPHAVWIRTKGVGEQERFKAAVLKARFYPALRDFEPAESYLYQPLYVERSKTKAAQPGATDNPDDAQRLREEH